MQLSKLTTEDLITLNGDFSSKEEVIKYLISELFEAGKISDKEKFLEAVMYRESLTPTGIDNGLAIPHGKSDCVNEASFAVLTLKNPISKWESVVETNKVQYVFLLAIPENDEGSTQMKLLSGLMTKMMDEEYVNQLFSSTSVHMTEKWCACSAPSVYL